MCRILLVDDDRLVLEVMRDILLMKDYEVTAVHQGKKALQLLAGDYRYDLVLTDLRMADADGFEIAEATKANNPKTPVILFSGWAADYEDEDLTSKGIDLLLHKPISIDALLNNVEELIAGAEK